MIKIILSFLFLTSVAHAYDYETVWPNLVNLGDSVQVQIHNDTYSSVWCTGSIYMILTSGREEFHGFSQYVGSEEMIIRAVFPYTIGDRVVSFKNGIYCNYYY